MVFPSNVSFGLLHSVCVSLMLIAPSISIAETVEVSIPATTSFTAVGVRLTKNEKATILADGIISYGSRGPESCQGFSVGPRGCAEEAICPGPGGCGSLLGRVNGGAPFLVGDSATATGPGILELGINDVENAFGDNAGEYAVRIIVTRGGSVAGTVTGVTCKNEVPPLLGSEACSEGPHQT